MSARVIVARNANDALESGLFHLATSGFTEDSRNGSVLRAPGLVVTEYQKPQERVIFSALRDANPFFHLYEAVWMMAGRNDEAAVSKFAKTMASFADADGTLNGAYGFRWRHHFGRDQLTELVEELRGNPNSRRIVLTMWDPNSGGDAYKARNGSPDVPCNTHVYFEVNRGRLNMTVCNRSNDIVWGAYGANYVHMGFLQESIAAGLGCRVGTYCQVSNNFHTYVDRPDVARLITPRLHNSGYNVHYSERDLYKMGTAYLPLWEPGFNFQKFLDSCVSAADTPTLVSARHGAFLNKVFGPMMRAHTEYTYGDFEGARYALKLCAGHDWSTAGLEWLNRREEARNAKAATNGA